MANQTASGFEVSADGRVLTVHGATLNYIFPYTGPALATTTDLAAVRDAILAALSRSGDATGVPTGGGTTPVPTGGGTTPVPLPPGPSPGQVLIAVGPTRQFTEPADALPFLAAGGTLNLDDAVYLKPFHVENEGITIQSVSGNPARCYFDGRGGVGGGHRLAFGKAIIHSSRSLTITGVGFRSAGSPASGDNYSNEAAVWLGDTDGIKTMVANIRRCTFDNCANGIFTAAAEYNIAVNVKECVFGASMPNGMNATIGGGGAHPAHDIYAQCGSLEVSLSYFYGACGGHAVKSRCKVTRVHNNPLICQDGGRALDCPDGGDVVFESNAVYTRKDRQSQVVNGKSGVFGNANMIGYCGESTAQGGTSCVLVGNTLNVSRTGSVVWAANGSKITGSGNVSVWFEDGGIVLNGSVSGVTDGGAPGGKGPAAPALPSPPSWVS